jgi:hypothetical protein
MDKVLIFALLFGRATVMDYSGPLDAPYDHQYAVQQGWVRFVSFEEAQRLMDRRKIVVLFAQPAGPVVRATEADARKLLEQWNGYEGKKVPPDLREAFQYRCRHIRRRNLVAH